MPVMAQTGGTRRNQPRSRNVARGKRSRHNQGGATTRGLKSKGSPSNLRSLNPEKIDLATSPWPDLSFLPDGRGPPKDPEPDFALCLRHQVCDVQHYHLVVKVGYERRKLERDKGRERTPKDRDSGRSVTKKFSLCDEPECKERHYHPVSANSPTLSVPNLWRQEMPNFDTTSLCQPTSLGSDRVEEDLKSPAAQTGAARSVSRRTPLPIMDDEGRRLIVRNNQFFMDKTDVVDHQLEEEAPPRNLLLARDPSLLPKNEEEEEDQGSSSGDEDVEAVVAVATNRSQGECWQELRVREDKTRTQRGLACAKSISWTGCKVVASGGVSTAKCAARLPGNIKHRVPRPRFGLRHHAQPPPPPPRPLVWLDTDLKSTFVIRKVPLLVNGSTMHAHTNIWSRTHDKVGSFFASKLFTEYEKQQASLEKYFAGSLLEDIEDTTSSTFGSGATTMFAQRHKRRDYINVLSSIYDGVVWDQPLFLHLLCLLRADGTLRRAKAFTNDFQFCSAFISQIEKAISTIKDTFPVLAKTWNTKSAVENNTMWYFVQTKALFEYRLAIGRPVCKRPLNA